jgi:uncharacterized protein (TIGR02996 family)
MPGESDDAGRSLLAGHHREPRGRCPRLIYADWLEEHGDADRAELIRVQIALAGLEEPSARRHELQRRERALIRQHKQAWLGQLPTGVQFLGFRRGFAEVKVYARAVNYLKKAERWYTQTPLPHLFRLQLAGARGYLAAVLSTLLVSRLVELSLYGNGIGDEGAAQVAAAPALGRLPALALHTNRIGPAGVRAIVHSPWLTRLTTLALGFNPLGDDGVVALAESPSLVGLLELNLFCVGAGNAAALALAGSPHLARLVRLDLTLNAIGAGGRWALRERFGGRVLLDHQQDGP